MYTSNGNGVDFKQEVVTIMVNPLLSKKGANFMRDDR